ncbi:MAG: IS200/IS605 family transposase [Smithellaceae bacterium]|nr:IS200/IS605 family transposase [Smithellaceae bacterium]
MGSFRQLLYHIIFSPAKRGRVLKGKKRIDLYSYISTIVNNKHCRLHAINGMEDHLHMLVEIRPDIAVSDLIKDIKIASSIFIKKNDLFPGFQGWQSGYAIFTISYGMKENVKRYIENQQQHHCRVPFYEEYSRLIIKNGFRKN